jgi:hypothetical protein
MNNPISLCPPKRPACAHNARDDLYGDTDPEAWGWRRPTAAELAQEALLASLDRQLQELVE